jgi:hypothetical protein
MELERDEELDSLLKRRNAIQQRLAVLELQAAQYGRATPVHIRTEISQAKAEIRDLNQQIVPETPAFLDRMSELERSKYNTALIMGLQATFVETRSEWRLDMRRLRADFRRLVVVVATLIMAGLARPVVTWHVWVLIGLTLAILGGVVLDMYWSERKR